MTSDAYRESYEASGYYDRAGVWALLDAATVLYRRKGQRRVAKNAQFQRVLALRTRLKELRR